MGAWGLRAAAAWARTRARSPPAHNTAAQKPTLQPAQTELAGPLTGRLDAQEDTTRSRDR